MSRTGSNDDKARRGRRRDLAVDKAIDQAVRHLLLEVGYNRMSIGAIARCAGHPESAAPGGPKGEPTRAELEALISSSRGAQLSASGSG